MDLKTFVLPLREFQMDGIVYICYIVIVNVWLLNPNRLDAGSSGSFFNIL